ncbi:hypothetical protein DAPPUDRAFT_273289 [Daphnia pulex]|jgi:hypothetical protein|uniref:PEP-CTERM protein-sorting domain-containing protein n=1 Tax=Daphnia pulex TaxID=6669 RepID=E9I3G7_DAPPU|nr:hypothetical protein DAPPUDRAFT_273289 [Daphnia pulex]|eukprot:EFX61463.1 hypothetical protein DAPPUDRAFT_273289 [Daphnia pulex]
MKFAFVAAALAAAVSSSAVFAAQNQDPNVTAAQVSLTAVTGTLPVVSPVPEADTLAMLVAGVAVVGGVLLRRRNKK